MVILTRGGAWSWSSWTLLLLCWPLVLPSLVIATSVALQEETLTASSVELTPTLDSATEASPSPMLAVTSASDEPASFPSLNAQSSILGEGTATTTTAITTSKAANSGIIEETTEVFVMPSSPLLEPTPAIMETTTNEESASFPSLIAQSSILGEAAATTTTAITTSKAAKSGIIEETTELFVMPSSPLLEPTPAIMETTTNEQPASFSSLIAQSSIPGEAAATTTTAITTSKAAKSGIIEETTEIFVMPSSSLLEPTPAIMETTTNEESASFSSLIAQSSIPGEAAATTTTAITTSKAAKSGIIEETTEIFVMPSSPLLEPTPAIMETTTNEEPASFPSLIAQSSILGEAAATTTTAITTSKAANSGIIEETSEIFVMPSSPLLEPTPVIMETTAEPSVSPSVSLPTLLPSVTSWSLDLNVGVLTLEVNNSEGLNVSTANCSAFQIVRDASDTNRSGIECSSAPVLSASSVTLTLSSNDQYLLSTDPGIATDVSNTFLVIEQHHQIFNDAGSLLTIPPASPLQAVMVIPDTTVPRLVSFTLDLDSGLLTLQFSEPVTDLNAMPSAITLQSASNGTGISYTLTGGGLQSRVSPASLEVMINVEDLNAVKALLDLATSAANTFLSVTSNITTDYAFNEAEPIASSNAVSVSSLIPDTTPPTLSSFSLDMNTGELMLRYNEPINASSFNSALITLQNSTIAPSTLFNLTSGAVSSVNGPLLLVRLSAHDFNSLASERQLAVSGGTTYIQVAGGVVTDTSGNPSGPVTGLQALMFTADMTRPRLLMFTLDLSLSELNLTFSEPVDVDTFNITSLTLQSGPRNMSTVYTLTGGTVRGIGSLTSLQLTLSGNDTAALQALPELATDLNNTYIFFPAALVADYNGNQVSPVSPEHPLQVSDLTVTCVSVSSICQENEVCNTTTEECDCLIGYGRNGSMTCTVINEFVPVFAISQNRSFLIPSLLAEGWLVTTLTATDMDIIDSNVTYYLEETGNYTFFRIGEVNGELRLNASLSAGNYRVYVFARDGGGINSDPFYISIEVFTIPQPDLTFEGSTVTIKETLAVNSSIFNVTCSLGMNSSHPELLLSADTVRQPFQVQRLFGVGIYTVVLMDDIDQLLTQDYSLTITCINSAYQDKFNVTTSENITVNIIVEDVPEVWIAFSSSSYSTNITENSGIGTIINLPVAVMKYTRLQDNASFENGTLLNSSSVNLTVVGLEPYLEFDGASWTAAVVRNIDRESFTSPFLFLNVSAEMANTTGDSAVIRISILDVNDNSPLISELVFVGKATTRTLAMEEILTVNASDADDGDNALIHFSLDNTTYFAINQSSGVIYANSSPLPAGEFVLTVTATDSGTLPLSSESKIAISVFEDLVANFDNDTYIFSISEELPPGSPVGNVAIATTAHVIQEPVYSIVPGKGSEVFHIGLLSGELVTLTELNRETNSYFNICISMVIGSSNATAKVLVTVLDINDNAPEFEESYYHFTLQCREQEDVTGVEYRVSASDRDEGRNADVVYSLQPLDNVTINNTTGQITPLACLAEGEHTFTVTATDGGDVALSGDAIVVISAVPALPDSLILQPGNFSLAENNMFGAEFGSIKVANLPESLLSRVEYSLQGNDSNFFHFDEGEFRAAVRFDRESRNLFTFQVVAMLSDGNVTASGSATVVVHILDENDNDPHFNETIYSPRLTGPVESRTEVLTVAATDADRGRNSEIFYSIEGQASHSFVVNNETGTISAKIRLDVGVYRLVAVAMDRGSTPRTDRVPVIVHVDHADPDALECIQTPFNFSVADGTSTNHFVGVIQVNVSNGVPLPRLDYQTDFTYFDVDVNGFLFTNASIDLDTQLTDLYTFNVTIFANTSTGVISVPCPVYVWVTSVNDNLPVLTNLPNSTVVKEERDIGTSVFNVTAMDKDSDAQLTFKLLTFQNLFQIDPSSGEITVKNRINWEDGNTHFELAVVVSDGKGTSNLGIMNVTIEDINDNAPVLVTPLVHTIDERCCVNEAVFNITVNDPDFGSNAEVVIEIVSPKEVFRIENTTVYLLQKLDFEVISSYNITINLTDNGKPSLSEDDVIEIVVVDKPDNPPVFGLEPGGVDQYYVPIAPNISAGAFVFHLMAFDPDLNRVSYSIIQVYGSTEGNFTKDDFEIGKDSGIIRKLRKGNFTADQNVTIVVEATDDSIYNVKTNVSVLLHTVPQNLTFVQGTYQFTITENTVLSDVQCKDMYLLEIVEVSRAREIMFRIVNSTVPSETFRLVGVKDESDLDKGAGLCLMTDSVLDHEVVEMIELLVQGSSATGIAFVTVEIAVNDVNDNPPIVNSDSTTLSEDERNMVGHSIAEFTVTDADSGKNGMYHLYIDPPDTPVEIFELGNHYSLSLTDSLNYEAQSNYTFDVVAVDTGEPAMNGSLTFHLSVVDINDPPVLNAEEYVAFAKEPITVGEGAGIAILTVTTTDEDAGTQGLLSRVTISGMSGIGDKLDVDEGDSNAVISIGTDFSGYSATADRYVQGTITAMDTVGASDEATLNLVIVPQTAIVVLLVGSRLSPSLFKEQEAPKLKAGLEAAVTGYQYAVYSVDRSGDELEVSGVFYNGPCPPGGPCSEFRPSYEFKDANSTEMTINSKKSEIEGIAGIDVRVSNQPMTSPPSASPPSTPPSEEGNEQIAIASGIAVVAVGVALVIFIAALVFFCCSKRSQRRKGRKGEHVDSGNWGFRSKPVGQDNIPMHQLMEEDIDAAAKLISEDDDMMGKNIEMPWWDPSYVRPDKKQDLDDTPLKRATVDGDHRKQRHSMTPSEDTGSDVDNYLSSYKDNSTEVSHLGSPRPSEYELFAQGKGNFITPQRPKVDDIRWKK